MIKHIIPKIGQGCCVEQFSYFNCHKNYRILYDCGSVNLNELKSYIDTIDPSVSTILVISHLHFDHINGIPYLVNHFKKKNCKIEHLFLPYYNYELIIMFVMSIIVNSTYETENENNQLFDIICSLQNSENKEYFEKVNFVTPHNSESGNNFIKDNKVLEVYNLFNDIYWAIKFWVDPCIYSLLKNDKIKNINFEDLIKTENRRKIKAIYEKKPLNKEKDFNRTSMLMASFLKRKNVPIIQPLPFNYCLHNFFGNGFVCTGDYPFTDITMRNEIYKHYFSEQFYIYEMTVPHHGGAGYCDYIPFDFIRKAYAQNGKNNKYKHPDKKVIDFFENMGIEFVNRQNL